jgi:hypothetical protein
MSLLAKSAPLLAFPTTSRFSEFKSTKAKSPSQNEPTNEPQRPSGCLVAVQEGAMSPVQKEAQDQQHHQAYQR